MDFGSQGRKVRRDSHLMPCLIPLARSSARPCDPLLSESRYKAVVSLGRTKEADEDGLRALETLASCPVLKSETGTRIKELVAALRVGTLTRVELTRNLETLDVQIEQSPLQLQPRRISNLQEVA